MYGKASHGKFLSCGKMFQIFNPAQRSGAARISGFGDDGRKVVTPGKDTHAPNVVGMLMGDNDRINVTGIYAVNGKPVFKLFSGKARIKKYGGTSVRHIQGIALAS
jgi:hypothetical protein